MNPEEPPIEPTPSPSPETVELQLVNENLQELKIVNEKLDELTLVNEKLEIIVTELTKEPTPEEIQAQETSSLNSLTYEENTIQLLQEISQKLTLVESTSTTQHSETLVHYENVNQMATESTWIIVFALALAMSFKILMDGMTKW